MLLVPRVERASPYAFDEFDISREGNVKPFSGYENKQENESTSDSEESYE